MIFDPNPINATLQYYNDWEDCAHVFGMTTILFF